MTFEELLKIPVEEARASWDGATGDERAERVEAFIRNRVAQYSEILGFTPIEILTAFQKAKNVNAPNYYQQAIIPDIAGVTIFENAKEFRECFPSRRYVCPSCEGISTNMTVCDSGKPMNNSGEICDWKAYGLFGTLGKGFRFLVKEGFLEKSVVYEIFKPIELESQKVDERLPKENVGASGEAKADH